MSAVIEEETSVGRRGENRRWCWNHSGQDHSDGGESGVDLAPSKVGALPSPVEPLSRALGRLRDIVRAPRVTPSAGALDPASTKVPP